jgi:hypothetical protein
MENAPMPDPISTTEDTSSQGYSAAYFKATSIKNKMTETYDAVLQKHP